MAKTAKDYFAEANELFVDEQFEEAGELYDKAIELAPEMARYYLHRASNNIKLENFIDAIPDCEKSLELEKEQHKAWERKGTAYFEMDEFESALESFEKAKKMGNKHCDLSIRKCKVELKQEAPPTKKKKKKKKVVEDTPDSSTATTTTTTSTTTKDDDSDSDDLEGLEGESWHPAPKILNPVPIVKPIVRPDWCQSNKLLTITLFIKSMKKEDVEVTCDRQWIEVKLTTPEGKKWEKKWHLWGIIKYKKLKLSVSRVKVEITVPKKTKGDWESIEDDEHKDQEANPARRQNLQTDYTQQKDKKTVEYWRKLDAEMDAEEKELKPGGSDGMDQLFKQIFRDATPETRRAMMKSYQTSGGTVLSTNWDEVGKTDYEKNITPPKGMEVRHYKDDM